MPNGNGNSNNAFLGQFVSYKALIGIISSLAGTALIIFTFWVNSHTSRPHKGAVEKVDVQDIKRELQHDLEAMEERIMRRIEKMEEKIDR